MSLDQRTQQMEQCTRCSQCKFVPMPSSKATSSICPSIDYGKFHAYSGGGKVITAYGYLNNNIEATQEMIDSVYACTMCGACDAACKTNMGDNIEPFDTILELRSQLAKDDKVPGPIKALVDNLEQEGTPKGQRDQRSEWARGLNITDARKKPVDVLLHIGSESAYQRDTWINLTTIIQLLNQAKINFGITFEAEDDSGALAYEIGFQEIAKEIAFKWQKQVEHSQAKTLVVISAHDYAGFKNIYPRLGCELGPVNVVHISEFLDYLLGSNQLRLSLDYPLKAVYHDSCRLGRRSETYQPWQGTWQRVLNTFLVSDSPRPVAYGNNGNYQAPRNLLTRINGLELIELERNKQFSYCCGGDITTTETYPDFAKQSAINCLVEAQQSGAQVLITGSTCCAQHMKAVIEKERLPLRVCDLFELITESLAYNKEAQ